MPPPRFKKKRATWPPSRPSSGGIPVPGQICPRSRQATSHGRIMVPWTSWAPFWGPRQGPGKPGGTRQLLVAVFGLAAPKYSLLRPNPACAIVKIAANAIGPARPTTKLHLPNRAGQFFVEMEGLSSNRAAFHRVWWLVKGWPVRIRWKFVKQPHAPSAAVRYRG